MSAPGLYWCPLRRWYTRRSCRDNWSSISNHQDVRVDDALTLSDLDWAEIDGELYAERWANGDRPSPPSCRPGYREEWKP